MIFTEVGAASGCKYENFARIRRRERKALPPPTKVGGFHIIKTWASTRLLLIEGAAADDYVGASA